MTKGKKEQMSIIFLKTIMKIHDKIEVTHAGLTLSSNGEKGSNVNTGICEVLCFLLLKHYFLTHDNRKKSF